MANNYKSLVLWICVGLVLLGICGWGLSEYRSAARAADYSAHAALTKEICEQLAAIPTGEQFPASLQDLRLTYPDGGDAKLLERFEFRSSGTQCTLRTVLEWSDERREEVVRTFPGGNPWPEERWQVK